ncbi:type II secretion system protein [Vibrio rotiferianus]|uniref:type II secretion system protein n=1 Tax=Vibrio rotiferianus TaxID=190895 RepID=UPI00406A5027
MKKFRGSYLVEMVAAMGLIALFATTVFPQFTNALKTQSDKTLTSIESKTHTDQNTDTIEL